MNEKLQKLTQYQIYCVIPIIVLAIMPRAHAIDARHAHNSALFHLAVSVVGIIGVAVLEFKKYKIKKAEAALKPRNPSEGVWPPPPRDDKTDL